jgi:predicted CoA-binding protein
MPSERIGKFYDSGSFAIIGLSSRRRNFAWEILNSLSSLKRPVYAIGASTGELGGVKIYDSLGSLPEKPEAVIVCTKPKNTALALGQIAASESRAVWFQQGSFNKEVIKRSKELKIDAITGCVMMYMPGTSFFHKIHRAVNEFFGRGYK